MDLRNTFQSWSNSHVFYDQLLHRPRHNDAVSAQGALWRQRQVNETPNGSLMRDNALFQALQNDRKLYLMHVSHKLDKIEAQGTLYPSGGCLVGAVYCAPLFKEDKGYRMHNLGRYILGHEAPMSLRNLGQTTSPTPILIELTLPDSAYRGLTGIDYLRLGEVHLQIFLQLEYLLSRSEREKLLDTVVLRVKNSAGFLSLCNAAVCEGYPLVPRTFLAQLASAIDTLPILGYLYFETLSEYLMLHTTSARAQALKAKGEFDNWIYKELLFGLSPHMAGQFHLSKFKPSPEQIIAFIENLDPSIDPEHLLDYTVSRMAYLVNARLFGRELRPQVWQDIRWDFNELKQYCAPLLGHLIHREMRTFGRYPEFYFYFDQYKALEAWNYWNHMDMVVPFNGTFPKGEIGINPAYPDTTYRMYEARQTSEQTIEPVRELDVTIAPRLVDLSHALLRKQHTDKPGASLVTKRK
jgi:hypothetical protein